MKVAFHTSFVLCVATVSLAAERPRLAVLDLSVEGLEASAGRILTRWLQGALVGTKAFNVVERGQVQKILDEADFQRSDCTENSCAVKAGRILNVGKVVIGSVGSLGRTYVITTHLVDAQTGKVEREARRTHKGDIGDLPGVLEGLARQLAGGNTSAAAGATGVTTSRQPSRRAGDERPVQLPGGIKIQLVWIPPGGFPMGSPANEKDRDGDEVQHRVQITKGFWMGRYEVTQEQWEAVMGTRPWANEQWAKSNPRHAVSCVSWEDCQDFVKKLNGRVSDGEFRLPTEAEWEYACRAGTTTRFYYGDDLGYSKLGDYAWYDDNADDVGQQYAHPVGQKKPNAWGLCDMHGNVWEWCGDWYDREWYGKSAAEDPEGPSSGSYRVLRGGSWDSIPGGCRAAARHRLFPTSRSSLYGFRIVCSPRGSR